MEYFNVELFLKFIKGKHKTIETKDISDWLKFSVRYIQRWAGNNDVEFKRIHGRKYYVWDELDLYRLKDWYERKNDKEQTRTRPIIGKEVKEKIKKEHKVNFRTIKDLVRELYSNENRYKIHIFQNWAKIFDVPFQYHFGRKYYIISDEIKDIFIELERDKEFYYEVFPENKHIKPEYRNKSFILNNNLTKLIQIAKEQEKYQRTK